MAPPPRPLDKAKIANANASVKNRFNYLHVSPVESEYDAQEGGGVSLLDYPEPSPDPPKTKANGHGPVNGASSLGVQAVQAAQAAVFNNGNGLHTPALTSDGGSVPPSPPPIKESRAAMREKDRTAMRERYLRNEREESEFLSLMSEVKENRPQVVDGSGRETSQAASTKIGEEAMKFQRRNSPDPVLQAERAAQAYQHAQAAQAATQAFVTAAANLSAVTANYNQLGGMPPLHHPMNYPQASHPAGYVSAGPGSPESAGTTLLGNLHPFITSPPRFNGVPLMYPAFVNPASSPPTGMFPNQMDSTFGSDGNTDFNSASGGMQPMPMFPQMAPGVAPGMVPGMGLMMGFPPAVMRHHGPYVAGFPQQYMQAQTSGQNQDGSSVQERIFSPTPAGNGDETENSHSKGAVKHQVKDSRKTGKKAAFPASVAGNQVMTAPVQNPPPYPVGGPMSPPMSTYSQLQDGNYSTVKRNVRTTPSQTGNLEQGDGTPTAVGAYIQSEPRNYAPRTVGAEAPPRFALSTKVGRARGPSFASIAEEDVFGAGSVNTERALVVSAPETPQRALVPLNPGPVPPMIQALRSDMLNFLTNNPSGLPDIQLALDPRYFPFIESSSQSSPPQHGVIKIKNIPFATKRAEVIAFLGRNSKILNDTQEPVHIIMERVTSKTQDAYVEFISLNDAMKAVEKIEHIQQRGRLPRLGDRPVDVELSSQSALMEDLFPHATGVFWEGCKPRFRPQKEDEPWNHFKGFVSEEEMTMLVKHVEIPLRSPFSRDCPQRPYECMISTIKKLPWWRADCITIRQRHAVYSATLQLLKLLRASIGRLTTNETCINTKLLKRLYTAAMLCPGFSVLQKDNLSFEMNEPDGAQRDFNQPRFPDHWTHLLALGPKPGVPLDVLEFYIAIIREETCRHFQRKPLRERAEIDGIHLYTNGYFGYLWQEIGFPRPGEEYDNMTLRTASSNELSAIERVLTRAFYRG